MATGSEGAIGVLVVDGDDERAAATAAALAAADDRIATERVPSVAGALECLDGGGVDCVLGEHELPDGDGLELLSAVRDAHGRLPVVLYTDAGDETVAGEAIAAGVDGYVRRDHDADQAPTLASRVVDAVEDRRIRAEQRRHLEAIETANEGISILDEDGRFVYVNGAYADLYGYSRTEMLGEHWSLVYPDDEVAVAEEEILPTVAAEGYWHGESTGLRADGTTFVEDHTVAQSGDGDLVCTVRDVTERRERERELETYRRELELKNRAIEAAPVGIALADASRPDDPVVYVNEAFEALTGYDAAEVVGRNCRFLQGEDTSEEAVARLRRGIEKEEPVTVELRNYRKDGTAFWNRVTVAPIYGDDGAVTHYVGFQEDITGRKEPARQLKVLHRVLRHNLANRMSLVRGNAEELADRTEGEERAIAEDVVASVDRLLATTDRHRQVVQLLSDRPAARPLQLAAIVRRTAAVAAERYPDATITVDADDVVATAVPAIETAVTELVDNAVRAPEDRRATVAVTCERDGDVCRLTVADDGPGIPAEEALILTGEQDVEPLYHGIGMGLWYVYWIVTLSGGTVSVSADDGTTITVTLPLADDDADADVAAGFVGGAAGPANGVPPDGED